MHEHLINQLSNIVEDAAKKRPMTWEGDPMPAIAVADPLGCLPLFAAATCAVCEELNIKPPLLKLQENAEASFGVALVEVQIGEHGIGAFMLTLRDIAINCDPELELMLPALGAYLDRRPESIVEFAPAQTIN